MYHDEFKYDVNKYMTEYNVNKYMTGWSWRFKGGGGKSRPPSSYIAPTASMQWAKGELYPMVERGMAGKGYGTSKLTNLRRASTTEGLRESFAQTKDEFESQMSRTVRSEDERVKDYLRSNLQRAYVSAQDDLRRGFRAEAIQEQDLSMGLAADYLAQEKRMSVSGTQAYNQALQMNMANQARYGTFATNLAGGVGSGLMDYMYSRQMAK